MQKLVKLQSGRICNYWIPNGLPLGAEIIGDVIPGERGEWLTWDGSKVSVNQALKDSILAAETQREAREQNEKTQIDQLKNELRQMIIDIQGASTAAEIKAVLVKIVKFLAFTHSR